MRRRGAHLAAFCSPMLAVLALGCAARQPEGGPTFKVGIEPSNHDDAAITDEQTVTLTYLIRNEGTTEVEVAVSRVSSSCCVRPRLTSMRLAPGTRKVLPIDVVVGRTPQRLRGWCELVTRQSGDQTGTARVRARAKVAFELDVLPRVELLGTEDPDPHVLARGPCGTTAAVQAVLAVRVSAQKPVAARDSAVHIRCPESVGALRVTRFKGEVLRGTHVRELRWDVRGRVHLRGIPGASSPVDARVFVNGKPVGSVWFVTLAEPLVEATPSRLVFRCPKLGQQHPFCVRLRSTDGRSFGVAGISAQGDVEQLSLTRDGDGYRICGVYRCSEDAEPIARVQLTLTGIGQTLVRLPVVHLGAQAAPENPGRRPVTVEE